MMPQPTASSEPSSIFNPEQKRNKKKKFSKSPSGDSTPPVSAEGRERVLDSAPGSRCNFQQGHEVPVQCRAPLPHRSCPRQGLLSLRPFFFFFSLVVLVLLVACMLLENGAHLLEQGANSASCSWVNMEELSFGQYLGRKSKMYSREKQLMTWSLVVPALSA